MKSRWLPAIVTVALVGCSGTESKDNNATATNNTNGATNSVTSGGVGTCGVDDNGMFSSGCAEGYECSPPFGVIEDYVCAPKCSPDAPCENGSEYCHVTDNPDGEGYCREEFQKCEMSTPEAECNCFFVTDGPNVIRTAGSGADCEIVEENVPYCTTLGPVYCWNGCPGPLLMRKVEEDGTVLYYNWESATIMADGWEQVGIDDDCPAAAAYFQG